MILLSLNLEQSHNMTLQAGEISTEEPKAVQPEQLPPNVKRMKPEELLAMLQDELTLVEGNSEKARQRILDRIFEVISQFAKMSTSQGREIILLKDEMERLQKLCKSHGIDASPPKTAKPKNRKERRAEQRKIEKVAKKAVKKNKKK